MTVIVEVKYVVRPEKQAEFMPCMQRILKYVEANAELFKEWKSFKLLSQMTFNIVGKYMELWGFETVSDLEASRTKLAKDGGWNQLMQEIAQLIDPATFTMTTWETVT